MDRVKVLAELKAIFRKIAPEVDFDSLNLLEPLRDQVEIDSVDFANILVQVHQRLGVNVPDSVMMEIQSLGELVDFIASKSSS
jgi:acyl carrier protein